MIIKLELTVEQTNIVLAGLGKLPLEVAGAVWSTINQQAIASQAGQTAEDTNADQTS